MLGAALAGLAGVALATQHPIAPAAAVAAVVAWAVLSAWSPQLWWFAVPASLPVLDFSPWTGALVFDEFDLLLLATLAGTGWRVARDPRAPVRVAPTRAEPVRQLLLGLVGLSMAAGLVHGLLAADGPWFGAFQGYADRLNSVRVTKSVVFALLFSPLAQADLRSSPARVLGRFACGMWVGMAIVAAAVFAERAAFPGLFDFSDPYRTTALFWEMHVGGAAIDVYTVVGGPFVTWAVWSARSVGGRLAAALLALAWGAVCLTTYSRGVWLSVLLSHGLLALVVGSSRLKRDVRWRRVGDAVLLLALLAEVGVVAGAGSFMGERLTASNRDFVSRRTHWRDGLRLLASPADWVFGIGSGRLPARYAAEAPHREFSGSARATTGVPGDKPSFVTLRGPPNEPSLGGLFLLTQSVPLQPGVRYHADLSIRARSPTRLSVAVCEMHLLYVRECQEARSALRASTDGAWQRLQLQLSGPALDPGSWFAPRGGVLMLSVDNAGGSVELTDVGLRADAGSVVVRNNRFAEGLAGWFPVAQRYFLPWHIDNFVLETLIERGVAGLLSAAALVCFALVPVLRFARGDGNPITPFLGAAIVAGLLVGGVSSVQDAPRVAFAFWLLVIVAAQLGSATSHDSSGAVTPRRVSRQI